MTETTPAPVVDLADLRAAICAEYAAVAEHPDRGFHFHTGARLAAILGYPEAWIAELPRGVLESMAGTGNPFDLGEVVPGERVVDCGSGAGADSFIAAALVGASGFVIGVDMTPEMLRKARRNAAEAGLSNVEFREGQLEALPVDDRWADVVVSNGVLNLIPDKAAALAEMYRVLRPGGRLQLVDIMLGRPVPEGSRQDVALWTGCIAGGLLGPQLEALAKGAGFEEIELIPGGDVFAGAPQASSASDFGTIGVGLRGRRPA